jgi:hypothetical protein
MVFNKYFGSLSCENVEFLVGFAWILYLLPSMFLENGEIWMQCLGLLPFISRIKRELSQTIIFKVWLICSLPFEQTLDYLYNYSQILCNSGSWFLCKQLTIWIDLFPNLSENIAERFFFRTVSKLIYMDCCNCCGLGQWCAWIYEACPKSIRLYFSPGKPVTACWQIWSQWWRDFHARFVAASPGTSFSPRQLVYKVV